MNTTKKIIILIICCFLLIIISPFIGANNIDYKNIFIKDSVDNFIFFSSRLQRLLADILTGGILALSGLIFQSVFKNPIATPYTLGVASGASLGAALFIISGTYSPFFSFLGSTFSAMAGGILSILLVYAISLMKGKIHTNTLLLAGVAINFFSSAFIMFLQYFADPAKSYKITRYMIGSTANITLENIIVMLTAAFLFFIIIYSFHKELDILAIGTPIAHSRGVNITATITILYFVVSTAIAIVTAITGPIGFVGMMIPHIIRILISSLNKILIPATFLAGGAFLSICDSAARVIIAPAELPVAIITSLLGAPFFIFLIIKGNKI